ncbi:hypothetical protein YC2023_078026 [Brassica napus]
MKHVEVTSLETYEDYIICTYQKSNSKLNHAHLLSLLGYCKEGGERILVYVFMAHASLHNDLHGKNKALKEKLDWVKRVTIAVQAARETLQENSGILTDIPTENEILGISRGISEDIPRKHKIWFPRNIPTEFRENINPSEYSYGIPRKNVFLGKNR